MLSSIHQGYLPSARTKVCIFLVLVTIGSRSFAADRYWIGTTTGNWNSTANWSTVSGGAGGASVPGTTDVAIFDGAAGSIGNCTINAAVNVLGLTINAGYTGTISQNANTITIGTTGASLGGGTFTGGSSTITVNGAFNLTGTAFTSTSGTLNIGNAVAVTIGGGTFFHNNGTMRFVTSENTTSGSLSLWNLTLDNTSTTANNFNMNSAADVFTVNNTLTVTSAVHSIVINTGTIEAKGDMFFTDAQVNCGGTATILIDGTGTQTLTGQGTVGAGKMPMVNINKPSGVLNLASVISVANNWTYTAGTISAGTSKVAFANSLTITGSHALNDVEFYGASSYTMIIASGTTLTVNGTTAITGGSSINLNTGTLESKGDITITNTNTGGGGTATLLVDGTGTQTLTGSGVANQGKLPIVNINKPSGTLNLASIISTANDWTYTAGTISAGTSRVAFAGNLTVTGSHTLNDVEFNASSSLYTITLASGTTLTANGTTYITGWNNLKVNTGTMECLGDITITNTATGGGGSATFLIDGTGTQTLTGAGVSNQGKLPIVNINKPSGTLNLTSIISTANNWTYTTGTVSPGTSRLVFGGSLTISGNQLLNDVEFNSNSSNYIVTLGSTVTAIGTTYISGSNNMTINGGTLECQGDVTITNTAAGGGGNATLLIDGTGTQTLTGSGTSGQGKLPIITINKPSGVLNLASLISTANNWTYTAGTVSPGTSRVVFSGNLTVTGNQILNDVEFNSAYSSYTVTLASGTTITANGTVYVAGGNSMNISTGTLDCKGDITITNTGTGSGGNATFLIDGTGTQTLTGSGTSGQGKLPIVTINKPSGVLNLASIISTSNNWTYTAGTISPGTSRVVFSGTLTVTGNQILNDVEFNSAYSSYTVTLASGSTVTANGNVYVAGGNSLSINTGTLECKGDITITNTSSGGGGTATFLIDGTGTQTLTGSGTINQGRLPVVIINKPSGTLNLASVISAPNNWTYIAGTIAPGTSKVAFAYGNSTVTGSHTLNDIEFSAGGGAAYVITIASGTTLTAGGTVTVSGANSVSVNTGIVKAMGDVLVSNTQVNGGGSATISFEGSGAQNFTSTTTAGSGKLPNININKPAGTLNMSGVITVVGSWNYTAGTVNAGTSLVYFLNASTLDAQGTSSTMNFYDITLGDNNTRTLSGNINIDDILALGTGKINLNANACTMNLNSTSAITRSSGYMISESTSNAGKISLNVGGLTGSYVYPFATAGGSYIPLTFQLTAGNAGYVTISTYPTGSNNKPYPVTPDAVTNVDGNPGYDNSTNVIDRFWQIDKSGASGTATVTYTYAAAEVTGGVTGKKALLQAQRYNTSTSKWDAPLTGQTANAAANTVTEPGITLFSPRALAISTSPLPIELLAFDATLQNNLVELTWSTATEKNNNFFTIEKTIDGKSFEIIRTVNGAGNSNEELHYTAVDEHPYPGISYYRLTQTDYDGRSSFSKLVSITYYPKEGVRFIVYPNPTSGDNINFLFTSDQTDVQNAMNFKIADETGVLRGSGTINFYENRQHTYTINPAEKLPAGVYMIFITVDGNTYVRKFVVR